MDDAVVSDDARRRIDTARVRKFAFEVKKVAKDVSSEDAEMLAEVILEIVDAGGNPDGDKVRAGLQAKSRSQDAADRLARAIGL